MYNKNKQLGMSVGLICGPTIPTKWMLHMQNAAKSFPGGLYWSYVVSVNDFSKDSNSNYAAARADVVKRAMQQGTKWLFFVDSDVFIPMDCITRLMQHDADIVTGVYWMKTQPPQPVIYNEVGDGPIWNIKPQDEPMEIGGAGLGCCLIKMDVFKKFQEKGIPWFNQDFVEQRHGRTVKVDVGEDHWFFQKARDIGYKVLCDTNVLCDHYDVNNDLFYPGEETVRKISKRVLLDKGDSNIIEHQNAQRNLDKKKPAIVFYNANNVPFDGSSLESKPIAGSETAIICMARELKNLGWNVHVCCNAENEGIFDGVSYHHYSKINKATEDLSKNNVKLHTFVSSRDLRPFLGGRPPAEKTVLWVHDMPCESMQQLPKAIDNIDHVFFVSKYQADEYQKTYGNCVPQDKIYITRNGVDMKRFEKDIKKVPGKCVYTTTPFRGLDLLAGMWPQIKEQVPNATLDIYSGMSIYNMQEYPETDKLFRYIDKIKNKYGITVHQPVKQDELADVLLEAPVMLYPSTFKETSCITAMEAIAANTAIITSSHSALRETIRDDEGVLIEGDPYSKEYQDKFVKAAVQALKATAHTVSTRNLGWNLVAENWTMLLQKGNVKIEQGKGHKEADEEKIFDHFNARRTEDGIKNVNNKKFWNMRSEWLESVHNNGKEHTGDADRFEYLGKLLPKDGQILDAGCSTGLFLEYLDENNIGSQLFGLDISEVALEYAGERVPNAKFFITDEDPGEIPCWSLDAITCLHTVEHLEKPEDYLNEWKKSLKTGGQMLIVIPLEDEDYFEHLRVYSIEDVEKLVDKLNPTEKDLRIREQGWRYKDGRKAREAVVNLKF